MHFQPADYGPPVARLVQSAACNDLGPGQPDESRRSLLAALTPEDVVAPHPLVDAEMARACLAGLWLRYDFLDASHEISQGIESPAGSFWHGILHRREGDFSNAKYWFRRVGRHPVFEPLAAVAALLAQETAVTRSGVDLAAHSSWDPFHFVDLCESAAGDQTLAQLCQRIQKREWDLLFDDCYRNASERRS